MVEHLIIMENQEKLWCTLFMKNNASIRDKIQLAFVVIYILFSSSTIFAAGFAETSILAKIEAFEPGYCYAFAMFIYISYFSRRDGLYQLVSELRQHYDRHKSNPQDRERISKCESEANRMFKRYLRLLACTLVGFCAGPFISYAALALVLGEGVLGLPVTAIFPWGIDDPLCFTISYLFQMLGIAFSLCMAGSNACTPVSFFMAIVSYFQIAQKRFREISTATNDDHAFELLKAAIKSQQEALAIMKQVEVITGRSIFLVVFTSALALSFGMFELSFADSFEMFVSTSTLSGAVIAQLYLLCYYGQKVIDEITNLCDEIYNVAWYVMSAKFQRTFAFCIMRSRKIDGIKAANFYDISFVTFYAVITSSYSYLACLKTMSE